MILAMPNTKPILKNATILQETEQLYQKKALCDYGLVIGACANNDETTAGLAQRCAALKMYLNKTSSDFKLDNMETWMKRMHFNYSLFCFEVL